MRAHEALPKADLALFCGLVWAAWSDRNLRLFENVSKDPTNWVSEITGWLECFSNCSRAVLGPVRVEECRSRESWTAPAGASLKLNVDAAWDSSSRRTALGGLVRDSAGKVLGVFGSMVSDVESALTAECLAIREGLNFARTNEWRVAEVESDSQRAVQMIKTRQLRGVQGPVVHDICEFIANVPASCKWIPRGCNEAANCVARHCMVSNTSCSWIDDCPAWLVDCVTSDLVSSFPC